MPYVPADLFPKQGVEFEHDLCFIVTGNWEDLHKLACQIKSKYVAPDYTVVLVSGTSAVGETSASTSQLIVSGRINLADDPAYRLVEQRIEEGVQAEFLFGNLFRASLVYSSQEKAIQEPDDSLGDLENHPF